MAVRKAEARAKGLTRRRAIPPEDARKAAEAACAVVLRDAPPPPGAIVAGYWPMRGELDPGPLLAILAERGHPVALPVTPPADAPPCLRFRRWDGNPASLAPGPFKTRHPPEGAPDVQPDWMLVPLLGFDRRGQRLGYGGGFYDRYLAARGPALTALGFAFAVQEIPLADGGVPCEPHDRPLTALVTDAGIIRPERL
ncbi:5-formyltetrahydrofolate cyclo-ligase [Roseospira marina]|uniref:5-formyltetrahydrofolate cyclo-ligase n=1 Tax=Roseospira marina TaxID=140057 RepID=A0A5M6IBT0_9PROT|nr:5-formyltetrahydrofolate cyclo-ligase [Roseospira marina]